MDSSGSLSGSGSGIITGSRGRKLSNPWALAKANFAQRLRSKSSRPRPSSGLTETYFDRLPVELLAKIFALVHVADLISLQCTSRSFHDIIDVNASLIARQYIRVHSYTSLHRLFPPPSVPATNKPRFDVKYLVGLARREQICRELSGYLVERILERISSQPILRVKQKRPSLIETVLTEELTQRMIYVFYFLTEYARRRQQTVEMLATHHSLVSSIRTGANIPQPNRIELFRAFQTSIISSLPTNILVQTHHTMHLLVKHMRLSTCPEPPHQMNDPWISMLLHKSGLGRITEFFAADMPYASHSTRKAFARAMQKDFDELENMNANTGGRATDTNILAKDVPPPIREIWFDAAQEIMRNRNLEPHPKEGLAVGMFGGIVVDDLSCTGCVAGR